MQNKEKNVCEMTEKELNDKSSKAKNLQAAIKKAEPAVMPFLFFGFGAFVGAKIVSFAINQQLEIPSLNKVYIGLSGCVVGLGIINIAAQGVFRYVEKKAKLAVKEVEAEFERRSSEQMCASKSMEDEQELNNF